MINIFSVAGNDQSAAYLAQIFGVVGTVLPVGSNTNVIVGMLFKSINALALTLGAMMVVYITVVGLMATAHEGEFLGKKWSGLWVPIRTVLGIAALFPTQFGYSTIQIIVMWVIMQGVGAADTLWTKILQYASTTGNIFGPPLEIDKDASTGLGLDSKLNQLFQGMVCQATSYITTPTIGNMINNPYYCAANPSMCTTGPSYTLGASEYKMGPGDKCGTLTFDDPTSICSASDASTTKEGKTKCLVSRAQKESLQTIVNTFSVIANKVAQTDSEYAKYLGGGSFFASSVPTPDWLQQACLQIGIPCMPLMLGGNFPINNGGDGSNADPTTVSTLYAPFAVVPLVGATDFIQSASNLYKASIKLAMTESQMASSALSGFETRTDEQGGTINVSGSLGHTLSDTAYYAQEAQQNGWILAGAYYYILTVNTNKKALQAKSTFKVSVPKKEMNSYRTNAQAASSLITAIKNISYGGVGGKGVQDEGPAELAPINDIAYQGAGSLLDSFMKCLSGRAAREGSVVAFNTNVLANISLFGYEMMQLAQGIYFSVLYTVVSFGIAVTFASTMALGSGNPAASTVVNYLVYMLAPLFLLLIGALFTLGATTGIYIPLIPYVVFIVGAIGWFMSVIEAMVAAPLVALGILSPGGQHEILGRAEGALMTLFNIFLRPSLMILGFIISVFFSIVVLNLINAGFLVITSSIISAPGLFEEILFIAAYLSLVVTALNKTFSIIFEVPNRVTTWIGGQAVSHGEGEALGQVERGISGAAGATSKSLGEASSGGAKSAMRAKKPGGGDVKPDDHKKTNDTSH